ncbi:MAG: hypothetical protein H7Y27_01525 [Gemmatimonadaceae bacterium]|nr:hypothetical protein [Chitinophagaceae bacterium]
MHLTLSDWIGLVGVTILLIAFLLNLTGKLAKESLAYIAMNIAGAGLACLASWMIRYYPFVLLEGVWTIVSVGALISYFKTKSA